MKYKIVVGALAALAIGSSGLALAQDQRDDRHGPDPRTEHRTDHGAPHRDAQPARVDDRRGAGPDHSFRRGGHLPSEYRSRQYVVDDWRNHHLSAPPRGYHWVQTGADYVLVAITTGIIAQVLLGN